MRMSIVTNSYNSSSFIFRLFESLQKQSFKDFEWIVVDDGSSDDTVRILKQFPSPGNYPMKVYALPFNTGGPAASAAAILKASGDIIIKIDHDDELFENALSEIVKDWDDFVSGSDLAGILYKSIQPKSGKAIITNLKRGQAFSWSRFMNTAQGSLDGLVAIHSELLKEVSSRVDRPKIKLNSVNLLRIGEERKFVYGGDKVLMRYHRDNPLSQTNYVQITDDTIYTYCALLNSADRFYMLRPFRWFKHTAILTKFSMAKYGSPFCILRNIDLLRIHLLCLLASPFGIFLYYFGSPVRFKEYQDLDYKVINLLSDLRKVP